MEKAYDLQSLLDEMKSRGLDLAEDGALHAYEALKAWLKKSAALSENKIDDMVLMAVDVIDAEIKKQIDKIDGEKG